MQCTEIVKIWAMSCCFPVQFTQVLPLSLIWCSNLHHWQIIASETHSKFTLNLPLNYRIWIVFSRIVPKWSESKLSLHTNLRVPVIKFFLVRHSPKEQLSYSLYSRTSGWSIHLLLIRKCEISIVLHRWQSLPSKAFYLSILNNILENCNLCNHKKILIIVYSDAWAFMNGINTLYYFFKASELLKIKQNLLPQVFLHCIQPNTRRLSVDSTNVWYNLPFPNSILKLRPRLVSHQRASNNTIDCLIRCFQS